MKTKTQELAFSTMKEIFADKDRFNPAFKRQVKASPLPLDDVWQELSAMEKQTMAMALGTTYNYMRGCAKERMVIGEDKLSDIEEMTGGIINKRVMGR